MPQPVPESSANGDTVRARRRAWWLIALVVGLWVAEITLVQHWTTCPDASVSAARLLKDGCRRAALDLCACAAVVCLLPGWGLAAAFAAWAVAANVLVAYAAYFHAPLSWPVVANQWREGLAVSDAGIATANWPLVGLMAAACLVKVAIARRIPRHPPPIRQRRGLAVACVGLYAATAVGLAGYHKPIHSINVGTPEYLYGYTVAWAAELLCLDEEALLAEALEKARPKSDRLSAVEAPIDLGRHMAVVQVESLDFAVIDARVDGAPVMPFLHGLRDRAMLFSVRPFHATGSSEADFSLLMAATPIGRFNPFQVPGFPYADALPRLARERGYHVAAFHGNTGAFFHRRGAYEQMGFDELFFNEELAPQRVNGARDDEVLAFSAGLLAAAQRPTMHFVITITSHTPFNKVPRDRRELFPDARTMTERYIDSMRYVDRSLERYVAALPTGTTVVVYGDHESSVKGYLQDRAHEDRVPWFIFEKGRDLSGRQRSRDSGLALSGQLTQLDLACYLRDRLAASRPGNDAPRRPIITIAREGDDTAMR
jgi:hypothetical protein